MSSEKNHSEDKGITKPKEPHPLHDHIILQWILFLVGLVIAAGIAFSYVFLITQARDPKLCEAFLWAGLGGFLGGAGRSLFAFVAELGGRGERDPDYYFPVWFLYLLKPFIGIVGGVSLFLLVYYGLVGQFSDTPGKNLEFSRIVLTAVIGGLFFESVFGTMGNIAKGNRDSSKKQQ
jgi:hypothetical protein